MESKEPQQQSDGEQSLAPPKEIYSPSNNVNLDTINGPSGFHIMCTGQIESLEVSMEQIHIFLIMKTETRYGHDVVLWSR